MRRLLFVSSLVLRIFSLAAQPGDIVKNQGIISPLHQAQIGKIIFTAHDIPPAQLKDSDFLRRYELTNKSDLFMTAFLGNSLTNYLHRVAPEMAVDSLTKMGGYQMALLVDHRLVYKSNILGAPLPKIKDTQTVVSKPLIDNENEGQWWSQFFWGRFMHNGGDSALTEGSHLLRMEIRPYVRVGATGKDGGLVKEGGIVAAGELSLEVRRHPVINVSTIHLNPILPYDGLGISTDQFDSNKIKELIGNIREGLFRHISGVVVIKDGKILIEEYFNGEGRDSLHDPRSVGKSFASTMTGIAEREGYLRNEEQTLKEFYPIRSFAHYSVEKETITLKSLLTMSSAFDGDDDDGDSPGNEENMYPTDNWVKFTLDLPLSATRPREQWHYFTAGAVLMGDILNQRVKGGLEAYADQKLFAPLGIRTYQWEYTPQHVANTAGGIRLKALDFAKYGQLYKNDGEWQGQRLLSKEWVNKTFTKYKAIPGRTDEYYGYFFWNKEYHVKDKAYETWYCAGNGGNSIFVFKDQPLVIVITATAYGAPYAHPQVDKMMTDFILPAVLGAEN